MPLRDLVDVPQQLVAKVVFDQSVFVKVAIENLLHEGAIGLVLTGLMVLLFLGSMRATAAVFLSIPLSALAAFMAISTSGARSTLWCWAVWRCVLASDRQLGGRAGKHFPAS